MCVIFISGKGKLHQNKKSWKNNHSTDWSINQATFTWNVSIHVTQVQLDQIKMASNVWDNQQLLHPTYRKFLWRCLWNIHVLPIDRGPISSMKGRLSAAVFVFVFSFFVFFFLLSFFYASLPKAINSIQQLSIKRKYQSVLPRWNFSYGKFRLPSLGKARCDRVALPNLGCMLGVLVFP